MKKIIFITGGSGFIGTWMVKKLVDDGHVVYGLARSKRSEKILKKLKAIPIKGDLTKRNSYQIPRNSQVVIHMAAVISHDSKRTGELHLTNVLGTKWLVEKAMKSNSAKQFVHISTIGVFGSVRGTVLSENSYKEPESIYETTKLAAEKYVAEIKWEKLKTTIIRPPVVLGIGDKNSFLKSVYEISKKGVFVGCVPRSPRIQIIDVGDLVKGITSCIDNKTAWGEDFILSGPVVEYNQIRKLAERVMERKLVQLNVPRSWLWIGYVLMKRLEQMGMKLPIQAHSVKFMLENREFSSEKAIKMLGFKAITKVELSITNTLMSYRKLGLKKLV